MCKIVRGRYRTNYSKSFEEIREKKERDVKQVRRKNRRKDYFRCC